MANIIEYNAPTQLAPQPSDRASSAHAMAARRIDIAYNQAGAAYAHLGHEVGTTISELGHQYVDYQFHREVSAGGLAAAHVLAGLQESWNAATRNGENDPGLQQKFMEGQVEPALEKFRDAFITQKGQAWADQHANGIRQHFFTTTTADISTNAGIAAHNNFIRSANVLSNMVAKDPSSLDVARASLHDQIEAQLAALPGLKGTQAARFREDAEQHGMTAIVKSAAESAIRRNMPPEEFEKQFTRHPYYAQFINAGEIKAFEQQQRQMERFQRADERYERQVKKQEEHDKGQEAVNNILEGLKTEPGKWDMARIIRMKDNGELQGPWFEHAVRIFDRQTKEDTPAATSADNARALFNRIRLPVGDPNRLKDTEEIYAAYGSDDPNKQINRVDTDHLLRTFYDIRSPDGQRWNEARKNFLDAVKPIITKSEVEQPGGGQTLRFYEFEKELDRKAEELGPKDRYKLLSPGNPDYMGTHERINGYVVPMDVLMRNLAAQAGKGPPGPPTPKKEEPKTRPPIGVFGGQ